MYKLVPLGVLVCICCLLVAGCSRGVSNESLTQSPELTKPTQSTSTSGTTSPASSTGNVTQDPGSPATSLPGTAPTEVPLSTPSVEKLPRSSYTLTAVLNYAQHHLVVDEQIHYINPSPEPLTELLLMIEPLNYPGTFQLNSINWGDDGLAENYTIEGAQLSLALPQPLNPGASLDLSISYELFLPSPVQSPETRPVPFGYTNRQTNLVDWYPFVPPYIPGKGWQANTPGFFGEHLVYGMADFDVAIQISDNRQDLMIAASAPVELDGDWYRYQHQNARNFAWSVSHEFEVHTTTVGSVTIHSYFFPFHAEAGEAVLETTAEAISLYNEIFGIYPRTMLSVVEADFLDGMEYDGIYFLSNGFYNLYQGSPGEYLITIAAHETAHQWFYALVGNDQAFEPWLDEALCTYSERLYYEAYHPEALEWWWNYRIHFYEPRGWVDGSIYNPEGYRAYRDAIYLNGALFLEDLRNSIGNDTFFQFLADYIERQKAKNASGDDFFAILSEHTATDITPLLDKYFFYR